MVLTVVGALEGKSKACLISQIYLQKSSDYYERSPLNVEDTLFRTWGLSILFQRPLSIVVRHKPNWSDTKHPVSVVFIKKKYVL